MGDFKMAKCTKLREEKMLKLVILMNSARLSRRRADKN
jgi:hypothetical protein